MCEGNSVGQLRGVTAHESHIREPIDDVLERLNDPVVAESVMTVLDNAELLSTLIKGLGAFVERGDLIMDSLADSVGELKAVANTNQVPAGKLGELGAVAGQLSDALPVFSALLDSSMAAPQTIDFLAKMTDAATEGSERASSEGIKIKGLRGAVKSMKDPDIQRGMGLMMEIARSVGQKFDRSKSSSAESNSSAAAPTGVAA